MGKQSRKNKKKKGGQSAKAGKEKRAVFSNNGRELLPKNLTDNTNSKPKDEDVGAHYEQYKKATQAVRNGLCALLPDDFQLESVNDLARAVDHILDASIDVDKFMNECIKKSPYKDDNEGDGQLKALDNLTTEDQLHLIDTFKRILVPRQLLSNLDTGILLRSIVSRQYKVQNSNDKGHGHILKVLRYCKRVLKACRDTTRVARQMVKKIQWRKQNNNDSENSLQSDDHDMNQFSNRFEALAIDDNEDSDDDEHDDVQDVIQDHETGISSEFINAETEIYSIEKDLIKGDDRLQACMFLQTMEDLMGLVSESYSALKIDVRAKNCSDPEGLMQCAMAANTCMYSVQRAEATLGIDYPYLSSIYCVLAVVFLPPIIQVFEEDVLSSVHPEVKNKCNKEKVISFLGSIVECSFHNKHDLIRQDELCQKFSKQTGLSIKQVKEKLCTPAQLLTTIEIQMNKEREHEDNKMMHDIMSLSGVNIGSHQWLNRHSFIGGERSILSTLRWLQTIIQISNNSTKLISQPGFFGNRWDEINFLAETIPGDLDELFCGSILPELLEWCKSRGTRETASLDIIEPYTPHTLPILHMLRKHMKENKKAPIPASLAFGMHCILTSIIEMQGDGDVARHAMNAERSWNTLFESLKQHKQDGDVPNHDYFFINVERFSILHLLPTPIGEPSSAVSAQIAFFNPLMAGSYLLFANYVIGIALGSCTVDSIGQLRFALHLYNAFKKIGHLESLPLLEDIGRVFKDNKSVWVLEGHPDHGEFCKRFLLAWGYSSQGAAKAMKSASSNGIRLQYNCRDLRGIQPEDISASYRMIMNRDFAGIVDDYSIINADGLLPEQIDANVLMRTISNVNMTRDRMDDDEDNKVSLTNWTQVGCILNEFILCMMKKFGWHQVVEKAIQTCPDEIRNGIRNDGSRVRGKFQRSDTNLLYQGYSQIISSIILHPIDKGQECSIGKNCANFMDEYFSKIEKNSYSFCIDDSKYLEGDSVANNNDSVAEIMVEKLNSMSVNKLKKTAMQLQVDVSGCFEKKQIIDLLASKASSHSSQRNNESDIYIRGTKVLKTTPEGANPLDPNLDYPRDMDGTTYETPLNSYFRFKLTKSNKHKARMIKPGKLTHLRNNEVLWDTPQLVPLPNGYYRHIASFTLKELRQIGWDGSMYRSYSVGTWVPYVDGYDSEDSDQYEAFDRRKARDHMLIGLAHDERGKYMKVPKDAVNYQVVRLKQ